MAWSLMQHIGTLLSPKDGSHRLPELHGPAAAALRRFVALAQGEVDCIWL